MGSRRFRLWWEHIVRGPVKLAEGTGAESSPKLILTIYQTTIHTISSVQPDFQPKIVTQSGQRTLLQEATHLN